MTLTTNTRPVDELEAGDEFRQTMVAKADADNHGSPMWHGWAIMEAFLAGIDYARKALKGGVAPRRGIYRMNKTNTLECPTVRILPVILQWVTWWSVPLSTNV